jgi:ArsR family transcriptional regulator
MPKTRNAGNLALIFQSLGDPTRLQLLNLLSEGEVCVCDLTETLGVVQPKVSRHLASLKRAGLVESRREGRWMHYRWPDSLPDGVGGIMKSVRRSMATDRGMIQARRKLKRICC